MSKATEKLLAAQQLALKVRPKVGGFPYLAEILRKAGVTKNIWTLPACQAVYFMEEGPVVMQMPPLTSGAVDVPTFNKEDLIKALRTSQAGESTFPEFLAASWKAGVVRYVVDTQKRNVTYFGAKDEAYIEEYPAVKI